MSARASTDARGSSILLRSTRGLSWGTISGFESRIVHFGRVQRSFSGRMPWMRPDVVGRTTFGADYRCTQQGCPNRSGLLLPVPAHCLNSSCGKSTSLVMKRCRVRDLVGAPCGTRRSEKQTASHGRSAPIATALCVTTPSTPPRRSTRLGDARTPHGVRATGGGSSAATERRSYQPMCEGSSPSRPT